MTKLLVAVLLLTSASPAWTGTSATEAIRALKGLHSALVVGLNYREYHQRLIEAKIIVDQYVEAPRGHEQNVQSLLISAMTVDQIALRIWEARLENEGRVPLAMIDDLHQTPVCPNMKYLTTHIREQYANSTDRRGVAADSSYTKELLSRLWECAADRIRDAEREMARPRRTGEQA